MNFEVWAQKDLEAGTEITIEYSKIPNSKLFSSYGFTVPVEQEIYHEWDWKRRLVEIYGKSYVHVEPMRSDVEAMASASSVGLSPIDVIESVVMPELDRLLKNQVSFDESSDLAYANMSPNSSIDEIRRIHQRRIERSGELAVMQLEPVILSIL